MQLEELIRSRKEQLDLENPPENLWQDIQKGWKKQPKFSIWKYAAILFLGVSTALIFYSLSLQQRVSQLTALSDVSEDYRRMEESYLAQISRLEKQVNLKTLATGQEFDWLLQELMELDKVNALFLEDLRTAAPEDEVVKVLIDYYEKKIRILNKLELEQKRTHKHEKTDTSNPII